MSDERDAADRAEFETLCEACGESDWNWPLCEGCGCCGNCCNCTETDCDCDCCVDRREER